MTPTRTAARAASPVGRRTRDAAAPGVVRDLVAESVRTASLVGGLAVRHLRHDPVAALLTGATLLPGRVRSTASRTLISVSRDPAVGVTAALGHWLGGQAGIAARALDARQPGGTRLRRHVAGELAVHLGDELGADPAHPDLAAITRARRLWRSGHVSQAVQAVDRDDTRGEHTRLASEAQVLAPGHRLLAPARPSAAASAPAGGARNEAGSGTGAPLVVHLLNNSLPLTQTGYTVRTQAMMEAQREAGLEVLGVTRIGYPVNRGRPFVRHSNLVRGVRYQRLLPARLAVERRERLAQTATMLTQLAVDERAQALATTTRFENALVVDAVSRALGLPWVYEVRGALEDTWLTHRPEAEQEQSVASEYYRHSRIREAELASAAHHVVTLSATMRESLVRRGVPRSRISVIPNGIDPGLLERTQTPAEVRARLGLPTTGFWVGAVSSLVPYEGFGNLLRAVARLRSDGTDVRVVLVGDGASRPGLRALAATLGIQDAVHLPGRKPHDEAATWVQALDAVTLPRVDSRVTRLVTPQKPVEAMALSRPLVVSEVSALAEVVHGEDHVGPDRGPRAKDTDPGAATDAAGLLVRPGAVDDLAEAIESLRRDADLRERLVRNGREVARRRTWSRLGAEYARIYRDLGVG